MRESLHREWHSCCTSLPADDCNWSGPLGRRECVMKSRTTFTVLAAGCGGWFIPGAVPAVADFGFTIFGAWWGPDETSDVGGGGIEFAFPFSERWELNLRGSYYEELDPEPLQDLFDTDSPFRDRGVEVLPIELGLRFELAPDAPVHPYIGGGGGYYIIDSSFGEIGDEGGWYGLFGL